LKELRALGKDLSELKSFLLENEEGVVWRTNSLLASERGVFSIFGRGADFGPIPIKSYQKKGTRSKFLSDTAYND
jgi:hypothetical protein